MIWPRGKRERVWTGFLIVLVGGAVGSYPFRDATRLDFDAGPIFNASIAGLVMLAFIVGLDFASRAVRRRIAARTPTRCVRCGYDTRASREQCPECGEPIVTRPVPAGDATT